MSLKELQKELDIQKWNLSEKECKDMCGAMPFCSNCDMSSDYPCASAFMKSSEKKVTAKKTEAKAAAPKKAAAKAKK